MTPIIAHFVGVCGQAPKPSHGGKHVKHVKQGI